MADKKVISGILNLYQRGEYVPYFPINTPEDVTIFGQNGEVINLSEILKEQSSIIDISMRSDFNKLYFETLGLHGGNLPLDSTQYISIENEPSVVVSTTNCIRTLSDTYILI